MRARRRYYVTLSSHFGDEKFKLLDDGGEEISGRRIKQPL
jgi:hypothetical protein